MNRRIPNGTYGGVEGGLITRPSYRSHLAMIENGSIDAKIDTLWRISEALGIRFSELMKRVEEAQIHNK